jgi:hypothetical protein
MSPQILAAAAATVLSLLFSYVPGFKTWYAPLSPTLKRLIMLALVCLTAAGTFGIACAGWGDQLNIHLTCDHSGALGLVQSLIAALAANQATFLISPKPAGKQESSRSDKRNGHPQREGKYARAAQVPGTESDPELPHAVSERYGKGKIRPHPDNEPDSVYREPHPVKVRPIAKQD